MTDDERFAGLFRDAASDAAAPPAGFDHGDVIAASRRITARRRTAVVGGAVALIAAVGVGSTVAVSRGDAGSATSASAPEAAASDPADPDPAAPADPDAAAVPAAPRAAAPDALAPVPGRAADPAGRSGAPLGPGTTACVDRQDPAVRAVLDQALPELAGARSAPTKDICLSGGGRGVTVEASEGGVDGLFSVDYVPPGAVVTAPAGALTAPTASGGTVIVGSRAAAGGRAPFANRLPGVVAFLAPRL